MFKYSRLTIQMAQPTLPSLSGIVTNFQATSTISNTLLKMDVDAFKTYTASATNSLPSIEDWIATRLAANDGTTLQLIASPLMWNEYADCGVFLGEPRVVHLNPREVMRVAATML